MSKHLYIDNSAWNDEHTTFLPIADVKASIPLVDGKVIEAAGFKIEKHGGIEFHACVSTQAGCKFKCGMCKSGEAGFGRNLTPDEILHQVEHIRNMLNAEKLHHIVFMGIGEPLDNSRFPDALEELIKKDPWYAGRLSLATVGLVNRLDSFAKRQIPLNMLWLSLHAPNDAKREKLMPVAAKASSVRQLIDAGSKFRRSANVREVRVNYLVYKGYNDSRQDAQELAELLKGTHYDLTLQLTEPNGSKDIGYVPGVKEDIDRFMSYLREALVENTIYRFLAAGKPLKGGCGEFAYTE